MSSWSSSSSLPEDIIWNILSRLPVKSLVRFKSVCKPWCKLLTFDSNFARMHLNHAVQNKQFCVMLKDCTGNPEITLHSIDYDSLLSSSSSSFGDEEAAVEMIAYPWSASFPIDILGTCNGLVCIQIDKKVIYIWNPSTQEYKQVPPPPPPPIQYPIPTMSEFNYEYTIFYGFGYDPKIDEYKLIIFRCYQFHDGTDYCVYTLGSNSWNTSQYINHALRFQIIVLAHRAFHWMDLEGPELNSICIVSFDIGDETVKKIPLPKGLIDTTTQSKIGLLGDSLCVLGNYDHLRYDLWVMKDYGVIESWTKLCTIDRQNDIYYYWPIQVLENGEILFLASTPVLDHHGDNILVSYEPKHARATTLKVHGLPKWFVAETYIGSLLSLNSGTFLGR